MKDVARMALTPGMEIAVDVYNYHNERIIKAGTIVDNQVITKLARHSVMCVTIMEEVDYAVTYFEKIRFSDGYKHFDEQYQRVLSGFKSTIGNFVDASVPFSMAQLMSYYDELYHSVRKPELIIDYLYNMLPSEDDMTYAHCLNAALIAGVFGNWIALSGEDLETLIQCAFLYDIGKLKLPNFIIWKPGKLNIVEQEQMKTHTFLGYQLIKDLPINEHIKNAALMHHERYDGSGYPNRLKDVQIDVFARYISIIDAYEAMTSARIYRESKHPFEVIEIFQEQQTKYDLNILNKILYDLASHTIGLKVLLSDDRKAEVILINQPDLSRPLLRDENNQFINLAEQRNLRILGIY